MEFGVEMDGTQDFFQMFWPVVVSHKIDEKSPLYSMSARDIAEHTFEIILTMEGITPETGNTVQVTSQHQPPSFPLYMRCRVNTSVPGLLWSRKTRMAVNTRLDS